MGEFQNTILPALSEIRKLMEKDGAVIVSIDGRCGSGKTRLADLVAKDFAAKGFVCNVFHMDDYYLPVSERVENWREIAGANMDFERFRAEVLEPVSAGRETVYRPYDCHKGDCSREIKIAPRQLNIVEGSYSQHPLLAGVYDTRIFLTCSKEVQAKRLQEREGEHYDMFLRQWIPLEERYIQEYEIVQKADLLLDTTAAE